MTLVMKRRCLLFSLSIVGAVSFTIPGLSGDVPQDEPDFTIRSDVRLVLLDVNVKDQRGNRVSGLTKGDFTVFENNRPQAITVFAHEDLPVTVGILVDESFSMFPKRTQVLMAAQTFIEESNPRDEVFVLNFNDKVTPGLPPGVPFSGDPRHLHAALASGYPEGKTALNDAIVDGLTHLTLGKRDKKALVVISDGGDNASRHTRRQMLDMVERSAATIYTIGVYDPEDPDRDPHLLRQLAGITGGDAYFPENAAGTIPICRRVARDIRSRYTIGYVPKADNGSGTLRRIHVRVSAPGHKHLSAQTRSSYRYDELPKQSNP